MTAPTPPTTPKDVKAAGSEYVILSRLDEAGRIIYVNEKTLTARDSASAIQKYAESNGNNAGTFIAIPLRSWRPVSVKAETVTTLKLEEVK